MLFPTALHHYTFINSWNTTMSFFSHNSVSFSFCKSGVSTKLVVWITLQFHSPVFKNILILKVRTTLNFFRPASYKLESLRRSMNLLQKLPVQERTLTGCFSSQVHALETCACWKFCPFLSRTSKLLIRTRRFWSKAGYFKVFFAAKQEKYATFRSVVAANVWFDHLAFC